MHSLPRKPFPVKAFLGVFFLLFLLLSCILNAEEPTTTEAPMKETTPTPAQPDPFPFPPDAEKVVDEETDHFFSQFIKMLGTLGLLLAVMIFSSWVLKGMLNKQKQKIISSDSIRVLERCQLSLHGFIYLIEVDNKTLLVGESAQSITLLTNLSESPENRV
ncbi:MAG: flagellar biosynthetic protein FliO [Parachlamydiaceae bacterium]|nr:flagellar biosynthetic protein FliO [Parachlamydiaceae bacterium]